MDEAIDCFAAAVEIGANQNAPGNLGLMLCRQERHAEAIPFLLESLRVKPVNRWTIYYNLGGALMRRAGWTKPSRISRRRRECAGLSPPPAPATGWRCSNRAGSARPSPNCARRIRLNPAGPHEMRQLAWVLATHTDPAHRNPAEAVRLAEAARDLTGGKNPVVLDTLAAAYADAGRTEDAVRVGLQAEELAGKAGVAQLARDARRRVDAFYRADRPFRESPAAAAPPGSRQGEASIREP